MSVNTVRENKTLAKISEFTVSAVFLRHTLYYVVNNVINLIKYTPQTISFTKGNFLSSSSRHVSVEKKFPRTARINHQENGCMSIR